jgi:hypothetical protein
MHVVLDAKRLTMVNRAVVRWLYDAMYPNASETPAIIKVRFIFKTPEATKILQGEKLTLSCCGQLSPGRFRQYTCTVDWRTCLRV